MAGASISTVQVLKCIKERIRNLRKEYCHIELCEGKSLDKDQQQKLLSSKSTILDVLDSLELLEKLTEESFGRDENESRERRDNERYLCVSDGCRIFCLDLKGERKGYSYDLQPLPKNSPPMFAKMDLSDVYGHCHEFPLIKKDPDLSGGNGFCFVYVGDSFKDSSSSKMYCLSLVDGSLSLSECDTNTMRPLDKPKVLSLLETIGEQIHVIESYPPAWHIRPPIPYNECLNMCLPCEEQFKCSRWYYIVVANRMYATGCSTTRHFEVFDSTTGTWETRKYGFSNIDNIFSIRHVAELLTCGFGKCIGKFRHEELYVVIAIGKDRRGKFAAAAYLVTPTGQVLCYQRLPLFFWVLRLAGSHGTLISVDEEGKTLCAIVPGKTQNEVKQNALFISTFTVEECPYAGSLFPSPSALQDHPEGAEVHNLPRAVEKYFVNVEVKEWHVYKLAEGDMSHYYPTRVSACFLSN